MREFFGFGGYQRPVEGYFSWQHLTFVFSLLAVMAVIAIFLGLRHRGADEGKKRRVLMISAILIDSFEIFKIVILCIRGGDASHILYDLPLFLCSIQLITIPVAAFAKGRVREAATDFVLIFGLLGAILGTVCAGNNYGSYPVLSFDNVVSGITHCISGFCSLYIALSGLATMKRENMKITFAILGFFCVVAYIANIALDYNYMFLMRGDGTPYDILFDLVGGNAVIYPVSVVVLFLLYITGFYLAYFAGRKRSAECSFPTV